MAPLPLQRPARLFAMLILLATPLAAKAEDPGKGYPEARHIVSLGGSVSEIVAALGAADRLVARDSTTLYPEALTALPDVGYLRALSPEGVLATGPDLILAEEGAGPLEAVQALQAAGVPFVQIPEAPTPEGVLAKIRAVAAALAVPGAGEALVRTTEAGFAEAAQHRAGARPQKVLFVLSAQGGRLMVAGSGTAAEGIITLAGARNAAQGFAGYKPMSDEAILAAAPDAVLMMDRGGDHAVSDAELLSHPGLAGSPAAARPVIRMDGLLLLGFGPRTPAAAMALQDALAGGA